MKQQILIWSLALLVALFSGCVTTPRPDSSARRFSDTLLRYPATTQPFAIRQLDAATSGTFLRSGPRHVFIIVHPAYSLFFREAKRSTYTESKYALLVSQFEKETNFIIRAAREGLSLILIIPKDYQTESVAPLSFNSYINMTTEGRDNVVYLFSESSSNGSVTTNDMVDLYRFLENIKATKALIGGGFIGRCQREFYNQFTSFFEKGSAFIVPEISTISPDDISEADAAEILQGIERQDYSEVRKFIDKRLEKPVNMISLPKEIGQ